MEDDLCTALETASNEYAAAKKARLANQEQIEKALQRGCEAAEAAVEAGWCRTFDAAIASAQPDEKIKKAHQNGRAALAATNAERRSAYDAVIASKKIEARTRVAAKAKKKQRIKTNKEPVENEKKIMHNQEASNP